MHLALRFLFFVLMNLPASESIVGGSAALPHSFPSMASLQDRRFANSHFCGGTLLNEKHVLTSGNCCQKVDRQHIQVAFGAHSLHAQDHTQLTGVTQIITHPDYDPVSLINDICILVLERNILIDKERVDTTKLPIPGLLFPSGGGFISGWGSKSINSSPVDVLQIALVEIKDNKDCEELYGDYFDAKTMICGGSKIGGFCLGDSGGPLTCENDYQCGIISWNIKCDQVSYPAVFTRVGEYVSWIQDIVYEDNVNYFK